MIQKQTKLFPCDQSGVQITKTFHLYKGAFRKISKFGDFTKVSVVKVKPISLVLTKTKSKSLIVRTISWTSKKDSTYFKFEYNNSILLKKRTTSYGKRLFGPILKNLKRKKLLSSFIKIL